MTSKQLIKILKKDRWYKYTSVGSHIHFKHPIKKGKVTVPDPRKDLPIKTIRSIEKQSGLKLL